MKKLKINLPVVLAIALSVTLTTCQSERIKDEAERKRQSQIIENNIVTFDELITPAENSLYDPETSELKELDVEKIKIK